MWNKPKWILVHVRFLFSVSITTLFWKNSFWNNTKGPSCLHSSMWLKSEINCLHLFTLKKYFYPLGTNNWHFFLFQISFSFMWYSRDRFWTQYFNSEFFNWRWLEGKENMRGIEGRDKINWKKSSGSCSKHILNNSKPALPVWILRGTEKVLIRTTSAHLQKWRWSIWNKICKINSF